MGIDVAYPAWWSGNSPEDLMIMGVPGVAGDFCGWRPAWRGTVLSDDETDDVMSGGCPLMRLRGEWAFIPRSRVSEIASRVESLPRRLSLVEAVRLAVRDQCIVGFSGIPEAERVYGAIRRGTPPEILGDPSGMTCELRAYQRRGYSWLVFLSGLGIGACLADDMGLGKTVQTLALVQKYREMGHGRPVLLICPTSVIENWRLEMLKFFPSMTFYVHHGHSRLKGSDFLGEAERSAMVLSSYSLLHRDGELYREADWLGVVLDEAQNIKNPDTRQARAARGIKSDWRIALTGTPIENHAGDLWSIMEFLMPGMLGSRRRFAEKYVKPMTGKLDAMAAESLRSAVGPLVTRRLKTDPEIAPDLPAKIQTSEYCLLKKEQVAMYSSVAAEFTRGLGGVSGIKRRGMVLAALTKMKQICDHPALLSRDGDIGCGRSSKLERLISLAAEMYESGGRALVFTQYVEMGEILKHQLQEHFGREVFFLHGGVARDGRDRMVRDFESGSGPRFFVLSLRAGGVGLNLTGANHVVMFDRWWNPAVESQAIDRAYRIGQKRNVHVHIFCCRGTLEERIDEMIAAKRRVADSVILESDDWITEMSDRDLRRLVSLSPEAAE
jgi:SNF2 family DNA or RNA helicase